MPLESNRSSAADDVATRRTLQRKQQQQQQEALNKNNIAGTSSNNAADNDKITLPMTLVVLAGSLGMFSYGYELTVLNAPLPLIESWINQTRAARGARWHNATSGEDLPGVSPSSARLTYSLAVAALAVGGLIGAPSAGPIAERIGRKKSQIGNALLTLVAAPITIIGGYAHLPELVILGRFLIGISNGFTTVIGPLYLAECSTANIRGRIGICNQVAVVSALWLAQILGLPVILGTRKLWPLLFVVPTVTPLIQLVFLFASPESPRWLYITRNAKAEATRVLRRLRPKNVDVGDEVRELEHETRELAALPNASLRQLFTQHKYLWPLSVAIVMHFSQALSGIHGIFGYSSILFREAGLSAESASYVNLSIGAIMMVMAFVTLALIDRLGRKALHLTGMVGCIIFGATISLFSALPAYIGSKSAVGFFHYANIASVFLFLVLFALGPASIPWMITEELFGQEARGTATSVACFFNFCCQAISFFGFPLMVAGLGPYVFLPHVALMIVFFIFLLKYLPETCGRTFEQVAAIFATYKFLKSASKLPLVSLTGLALTPRAKRSL